jgi:UDP-N-acetylglucosamine 2-epimerase (non-hydrolysing)
MLVFGTRPEAIKMAPVALALERSESFERVVVVTAQHREMLDQVLDLFGIEPDVDLNIIQPRQTLTSVATRALEGLSAVIEGAGPDAVVVQGDTTTTFAGALAAFYARVPVVHMEAGLRTNDACSPYPEEINRRLASQLATLHLAATPANRQNLLAENIAANRILVTGNTVIDALLDAVDLAPDYGMPALAGLDSDRRRVLLVTAHRRESWGEPLAAVGRAVAEIAATEPDVLVVFPLHKNPAVREAVMAPLAGLDNVLLVEPVAYGGFARLMRRADVILTDSGGVQEEGPSLGKPVLVMRDVTERPEAVAHGAARLVGTDERAIVGGVRTLLHDADAYAAMANAVNPYGDGRAAQRTVAALDHLLRGARRPDEFAPGLAAPKPPHPTRRPRGARRRAGAA